MNALIFKDENEASLIPFAHPKAGHIRETLKAADGDFIYAGIAGGPLFKARIETLPGGYRISGERIPLPNPPALDAELFAAFTRPQIAKRILFEAACFGVRRVVFYAATKGEAGYARSSLYSGSGPLECLIRGAEQACATSIPEFASAASLGEAVSMAQASALKIAPDPYEATAPLSALIPAPGPVAILFGGERGFSNPDRELLREGGFTLASMGPRILRTDSAIIAALARCASAV